jgi:glycosyltransferase involved in cell wall biosynthesis
MHGLYSISVLTTDTDLGQSDPYPDIIANQWMDRAPGIRIYYASEKTLTSKTIKNLIDSVSPDFIYVNSMYSVRFTILPLVMLWRNKIQVPVILSPRGMLRESAIRMKSTKKKLFIALLNFLGIPGKIRFHATDEQERKDIHHYFPHAKSVDIVPNFSAGLPPETSPVEKTPGQLRCVFISRIMGIKNILFFLQVLKQVPESIRLEFAIYGEIEDADYWSEAQTLIRTLPVHISVFYGGPLPHAQVIPMMAAHHVFVLPTKGENFGHAIFEALSAGRPVLISNKTPWLGLREKGIGWDLSLDDPASWIAAIREAADFDQPAFNEWAVNCRKFAKDHQENPGLKEAYIKLFSGEA